MDSAHTPSQIVTLALALAQVVERWTVTHRTATLAEHEQAAGATDPPVPATDLLVIEADGVMVRYTDGWHEAKVGEVAGCQVGDGRPRHDPAARPSRLVAPS